jgi:hypothetical protein
MSTWEPCPACPRLGNQKSETHGSFQISDDSRRDQPTPPLAYMTNQPTLTFLPLPQIT